MALSGKRIDVQYNRFSKKSADRRRVLSYKTCLDTKPVLYQDRFCSLTDVCRHADLIWE